MFRRFWASFCACFVVFALCAPLACATGVEPSGGGSGGIGIPVGLQVQLDVVDFWESCGEGLRRWGNRFGHVLDDDVCPSAPQLGGGHSFVPRRTLKQGQVGLYYVCEYCGKAYGDALDEAYQDYVETLPGTQYNSGGAFLWKPGPADFQYPSCTWLVRIADSGSYVVNQSISFSSSFPSSSASPSSPVCATFSAFAYIGDYISVTASNHTSSYPLVALASWPSLRAPVDGFYTAQVPGACGSSVSHVAYSAGSLIQLGMGTVVQLASPRSDGACQLPWPSFWVESYTGGSGGNTYELTTRVCGSADNNQGMYGYVEDGTLYQSNVTNIYNETSNVYTNPVTGTASDVSSWTYDYSDRSYHLTTDEGDAITVTYGDEAITINEGDTVYNVLYLMEEPDNVTVDSSHTHSYTSSVTQAPTCTTPGVRTLTCSGCGDVSTETIPALGHDYLSAVTMEPTCVNTGVRTFTCSRCGDVYTVSISATGHVWQIVRSVPTTYDSETGQLVQEGYTLYECATCGEQYKITSDSGGSSLPSPSGGGTSTGGGSLSGSGTDISTDVGSGVGKGFLASIAQGLTEDLPAAIQAASSWFASFPALYEGYTGFMAASLSWLPSDIQALFRFSVAFVTFVGIIRRIWGRG